jgi:mono/diheme cytochrome c family protein
LARPLLIGMARMKHRVQLRRFSVLAPIVAIACGLAFMVSTAAAESNGKHDYQVLCASCHGADGTGKGAVLSEANAANLTLLSQKNGGKFPVEEVYRTIDGRELTGSHKRFAMPFWGQYLERQKGESTPESQAEVKHQIMGIVRYLETIQKK